VKEPRPVIEGLLAHCGLPWDDACLDFHLAATAATATGTPGAWRLREPLHAGSSGRWRHYERHLGPLRDALGNRTAPPQPASANR